MMQKRTLYLSLLLASLLLVFAISSAMAQSVTFQSKTVPRCSDVVLNITVTTPSDLSAFEIVFAMSGSYSNFSVNFDGGLTVLTDRVLQKFGSPDTVRMAAMKINQGDVCLPAGTHVVGQIHFKAGDVCSGTISVAGATVSGVSCNCAVTATTGLVGCNPIEALATTVVNGAVTVTNQTPTIACPGDQTVHWGDVISLDVTGGDPDVAYGCETLTYTKKVGPATMTVNPTTGHISWATAGSDVCTHPVTIEVTDKCGAKAECSFSICVQNTPPVITFNPADTIFAVWDILLSGSVNATDPDGGPAALAYTVVSFNGPTTHGSGLTLNAATGAWTWDIGEGMAYAGNFQLLIKASDGANVCTPCSPANADTATYNIRVTGFAVSIQKVHSQLQGHNTTASIFLDSAWTSALDKLGGFDFLVGYDASALTFISATPGALIDNNKFEYFTYRYGPDGNCGNGCPSGLLRVVGLRETNNGVTNPNHITGPGELVQLHFLVSNDRNLGCQFVPIRFYWIDCGDNTLADESGNWLYLGLKVFDFTGAEITDPLIYGYSGPADTCFDTVYTKDSTFKNAPIGAIIFRDGGIDIICADSIDKRGDVNLNGLANEIGDAVVFTNYFINGLAAFTINAEGQIAATEVNGDGVVLSVADLVYLIRVIVGDALPLAKTTPGTMASFYSDGQSVKLESPVDLGAALFIFQGEVQPSLAENARSMEIKYGYRDGMTRVLVYSMEHRPLTNGEVLSLNGHGSLVSVEASDYYGAVIATNKDFQLPTEFALSQNYPNPFNPTTAIELALPVASNWTLAIYNVSGQKVADYSGYHEAGTVTVTWDASNMASGMYFYKANAGNFSATKKMVLLK